MTFLHNAMEDIPYDIWHSITTFLPSQEVKRLYALNRSLYNIAMDERYRSVFIGSFLDERTKWNIKRVVDPEISSRVRHFTFKPGHLCKLLYENASTRPESAKTLEDPVSDLIDALDNMQIKSQSSERFYNPVLHCVLPLPAHWTQRNVLKILKQLTSLTSLQVVIQGSDHWYLQRLSIAPSFFSAGWSAFSSTLTSLELRVHLEDMSIILPPAESLPLQNLERLSLQILRASLSTDTSATTLEILLPLINQHRATLRSLSLGVMERIDVASFLQRITHLQRLQSFSLKQSSPIEDDLHLSGLKHILQIHRHQLIDFSLRIAPTLVYSPISYQFFDQGCFGVTLPKLLRISMDFRSLPADYSLGLIPYIHKFKATLVSLDVSEHRWSLVRLNLLLEGFPADSPLRDLKISISLLEPKVFKVLADSLPRLDTLKICFDTFGPDGYTDSPIDTTPRFADELNLTDFSGWDLRKLDLSPINLEKKLKFKCKLTLINAFPTVETFCGLPPMEYYISQSY